MLLSETWLLLQAAATTTMMRSMKTMPLLRMLLLGCSQATVRLEQAQQMILPQRSLRQPQLLEVVARRSVGQQHRPLQLRGHLRLLLILLLRSMLQPLRRRLAL